MRNNDTNFTQTLMLTHVNNLSLRVAAAAFALSPTQALAGLFGDPPNIEGMANGDDPNAIRQSVIDVLQTILSFMALIAVIFIVIAGIRLVVSQGEEGEKDKAKKTIIYVIIGLIVILFAKAIVQFVATLIT